MLAEAMGGSIDVESQFGAGSCFTFSAVFACNADVYSLRQTGSYFFGLSALVVDDNASSRDALVALQEACGIRVTALASGGEALSWFAALENEGGHELDLLLVDAKMPSPDGLETIEAFVAFPDLLHRRGWYC